MSALGAALFQIPCAINCIAMVKAMKQQTKTEIDKAVSSKACETCHKVDDKVGVSEMLGVSWRVGAAAGSLQGHVCA